MGNHKFRLSDMMPNAWFYKLKYMGNRINNSSSAATHYSNHQKKKKKTKQSTPNLLQNPRQTCSRKSYYFTRDNTTSSPIHPTSLSAHSKSSSIDSLFPDPPTTYKHAKISPNTSASEYNYPSSLVCPPSSLEMRSDRALPTESFEEKVSWSSSCNYEPRSIVIDIDGNKQLAAKIENSDDFVTIFDLELRPILTKQKLADNTSRSNNKFKSQQDKKPNSPNNSEAENRQSVPKRVQGMKLRVNSPRIGSKRFPANGRRSLSSSSSSSSSKKSALAESLAIVKRSVNPQEDFKQSMVEMIVEHEIRSSKDLEELLACYLSLNSDEYHDLIISVFKQIWFQLSGLHNNETN